MVKNIELERVVLSEMSKFLIFNDSGFNMMCDGEEEFGKSIIQSAGKTMIDKSYKIRIHFSRLIGYGYDFNEDHMGEPPREVYERAVKYTKERILGNLGENFHTAGVVDNRYGWYITSI